MFTNYKNKSNNQINNYRIYLQITVTNLKKFFQFFLLKKINLIPKIR